jgi:hypothetical protein
MSRDSFTQKQMHRFLTFHYAYADVCQKVGGRKSRQWASFVIPSWPRVMTASTYAEYLMNTNYSNRYIATNINNAATIELRYFKGTVKPGRMRAYFEWAHLLWKVAGLKRIEMTPDTVKGYMYLHSGDYPNIIALFERKPTHTPDRRP